MQLITWARAVNEKNAPFAAIFVTVQRILQGICERLPRHNSLRKSTENVLRKARNYFSAGIQDHPIVSE